MVAIGVIEISTISKGYRLSDEILKLVEVDLTMAQPICPGKFVLIVAGRVANVRSAMEFAEKNYAENLIDISFLGRISDDVYRAILGSCEPTQRDAVGMIETFSIASVIKAADIAVKSAGVEVIEVRIARGMGGKSYVILTGSVSNVEIAVQNGARHAIEEGQLVDTTVIADPHEDLWQYME